MRIQATVFFNGVAVARAIIDSIIVVDLDDDEKIIKMVDQWNGKDLPRWHGAHYLRVANAKLIPWLVSTPKQRCTLIRVLTNTRLHLRHPQGRVIGSKLRHRNRNGYKALQTSLGLRSAWPRTLRTSQVVPQSPGFAQSSSPLSPIGVNAALQAAVDPKVIPRSKIFDEFSLNARVGIVSGGNRGLGLEMALALCELGARAIYCFDLPSEPSKAWKNTEDYVKRIGNGSRLEYVSADVRNQKGIWDKAKVIGDKEGRIDVCVAAAGILPRIPGESLNVPHDIYQEVIDVNMSGVLYTAQAAGQQMLRFGNSGSIILISSIAGHNYLKFRLGKSDGSSMTAEALEHPDTLKRWSDAVPMGRIGRPDELRGVVSWLASDASSFCTGSKVKFQPPKVQSVSPLSPIGVTAAIQAATDPTVTPRPKIFDEFSLKDRVGIVTGGNRGLGLEMALALSELGARAIYCFDLPSEPSEEWKATEDFVKKMGTGTRLEYVSMDVRDQKGMWDKVEEIGDKEGRMDVCVAAAGVLTKGPVYCLACPADAFQGVGDVRMDPQKTD
ncbi:hypothetical protein H0H87_005050 [Tephrocybe sp. NHM501043]|nr:hypothetical protein H0H87_005050 [Tephrocybe sp. NHM501043]